MNIMHLIFSFNIGGIERLLVDLCNETAARGYNVTLCVINGDYTQSIVDTLDPAVEWLCLGRSAGQGSKFQYMQALSREISERHIDILHCQGINCVLFAAWAKIRNPHLVVLNTVHDSGNYPSYSNTKIWLQNRICNHTIAISNSVRREILARGLREQDVTTIYNAIDTEKFQLQTTTYATDAVNQAQLQTATSTDGQYRTGRPQLGNVARFFPAKKGQDTLIKAVEILKENYPNIHCAFAGETFKGQQQSFNEWNDYVNEHNLSGNITFLGNVDDIPAFLHALDIFVLPSNYEGFGIALIEALSCGIPVVASALQGPEEIFSLAGSLPIGQTCPADDAQALADAIATVLSHRTDYDSNALHAFVEKHFSKGQAVTSHLTLYERLLGKR